jgi:hypothetical protein
VHKIKLCQKMKHANFINIQLKGKQFEDFEGTKHPYPQFEPKTWMLAKLINDRWVLACYPPAGVHASVSLDKDGRDPKLESYGWSPL